MPTHDQQNLHVLFTNPLLGVEFFCFSADLEMQCMLSVAVFGNFSQFLTGFDTLPFLYFHVGKVAIHGQVIAMAHNDVVVV